MNEEVRVVNGLSYTLRGRFAAQDYVFAPNKPTDIPLQAAQHIFALGLDEDQRRRALACLGIYKDRVSYSDALTELKKVKFLEGTMTYKAQQQEPEQPPKQPGKPGPGKNEDEEESEESGGTRPGAPKGPPGRKSEGGEVHTLSPSDDLKRKW